MKNITLKLFPFLIALVFLFPILKENISSLTVILLTINLIVYKAVAKDYSFINFKALYLTIPFWIILLFSVFTTDLKASMTHIQHSLFFLVIPIVFSLIPIEFFSLKKFRYYLSVLKNVCLFIAVSYVVSYFMNNPLWKFNVAFFNDSTFRDYIYNDFKLFVIHPAYYTTILITCSAHSLDLILKEKKYYQVLYVLAFLTITFLLLTKLNIVVMVTVLFMMMLLRNSLKRNQRLVAAIGFFLIIASLAVYTPGINNRFRELYDSLNVKPQDKAFNSTNVRRAIFDCSVSIAKDNWSTGVGFENLQKNLNTCYSSNYHSDFFKSDSFMTHNYYFYILLSCGIGGLFIYLVYLANLLKICYKSNIFLFNVFLLNALIICFIEDYFYRHYGILYFNVMLMCFIRLSEHNKTLQKFE